MRDEDSPENFQDQLNACFDLPVVGEIVKLHFLMFTESVEMHAEKVSKSLMEAFKYDSEEINKETLEIIMNICKYSYMKGVSSGFRIVDSIASNRQDQ